MTAAYAVTSYDPDKHAALLAEYCLYAAPGERLLVTGGVEAAPLLRAVTRALLVRGARPVTRLDYPGQNDDLAELASEECPRQLSSRRGRRP